MWLRWVGCACVRAGGTNRTSACGRAIHLELERIVVLVCGEGVSPQRHPLPDAGPTSRTSNSSTCPQKPTSQRPRLRPP